MLANFLLSRHSYSEEKDAKEFSLLIHQLISATNQGASCIDLLENSKSRTTEQWEGWLRCGENDSIVDAPSGFSPIVLKGHKLYLRRYYEHEVSVAHSLRLHMEQATSDIPKTLLPLLDKLFPNSQSADQRNATETALTNNFCMITGGPGTGKTTTVVKILFLLALMGRTNGSDDTLLLAPTGKAADRLSQSIKNGISRLIEEMPDDAIITSSLPREASTIHRALGYRPDSIEFRHNNQNPLSAKLVIVDETSMVDLPLMARLLSAIPPSSHIIFLGDQHQLASVQIGSVLADLVHSAETSSKLSSCYANLTTTFRTTGAIKECCDHIRLGNSLEAWNTATLPADLPPDSILTNKTTIGSISTEDLPPSLSTALEPYLLQHWLPYLKDNSFSPQEKLASIDTFRILTPIHHGPYGIHSINQTINRLLNRHGFDTDQPWFIGRSIIVTSNNYSAKVYNGDTGLTLPSSDKNTQPHSTSRNTNKPIVYFPSSGNESRTVSPARLPDVETAWALTIHRTQGSEYEHILLILPPSSKTQEGQQQDEFVTRELLYTGLSRAKHSATIWTNKEHFEKIIQQKIMRPSGLSERF